MSCLFVCTLGSGAGGGAAVALPHSLPRRRRRPASPARPAALVSVLTASGRPCDDFRIGAGAPRPAVPCICGNCSVANTLGDKNSGRRAGSRLARVGLPAPVSACAEAPCGSQADRPPPLSRALRPAWRRGYAVRTTAAAAALAGEGGMWRPGASRRRPAAGRAACARAGARARADRKRHVPARRRRPHGAARN